MDLFSRKVISFSISDRIDTMMTIEAFNEAFKKEDNLTAWCFTATKAFNTHALRLENACNV